MDELNLVGRRGSPYGTTPVSTRSDWIRPSNPSQSRSSYLRVTRIDGTAPNAAKGTWFERPEINLGLRHWNTIVFGCGGEGELG